ncbi:hypothetical protein SAY87_029517 [Trapa incisa]|uniref:RRM domain-containing protein n=1 Tax=Trapa incisa TaxID=236973 RepID=A0AAN7KBU0_9MYRT|nr:hypothetical protein SAY87_029517 [Trapa incisa]
MATALEAAFSVFPGSPLFRQRLLTLNPVTSLKLQFSPPSLSQSSIHFSPLLTCNGSGLSSFPPRFSVQDMALEADADAGETSEENVKRKLYVANLPWSLSVVDIKKLFGECGTVKDVEIIKQKDGRSKGFAFVTMASGQEAQDVVDKFDSHEVSGRIIRVDFAKRFKRPSPNPPPPVPLAHKLYVSNLAWKARSNHLRELFSENFNPISSRVVFENASSRSAGYGFVSFATREEAEAALSALDGKELMGRPLRLKFSERNVIESSNEKEGEDGSSQVQPES